ncbi:MAG: bis(5'-nucleosyl)-tetraphosphatase (symmetrical) YqeK [Clostridia bacterium]|nr:bis(5'-nucleosyl)-tetraphosphatase (symmetrical) YqeK [Clostridia bacterium]
MKKTVIFGGTFDPPHEGHKNLLRSVMKEGYDRAIVIPASVPPHKQRENAQVDFERRLALTRDMFSDMENVSVSDIEGKRKGKSFTIDTIEELERLYPDDRLYFLMGSDMLLYLEKWYRFEDILKKVAIISAARTQDDVKKIENYKKYLESKYDCDIIIYNVDIVDISSTVLRSPLVRKIDAHNKANLSEERYDHVISVANYAVKLASLHGVDPYSAYVAALAHDCTKYLDDAAQLEYFEKNGIKLSEEDRLCPKIYHQISGAHFAKTEFDLQDEDILNAIRYHTTGRVGMSKLELLVCLADSIEPTRDYAGVEKMRKTARTSLEKALCMCLDRTIEFIKQRGLYMHSQTVKARDWLKGNTDG